jgi:hypothetical protein
MMKDFFKREFELLEAKTGFKQYEKILDKDTWERDLEEIINLMVAECNRPPFDMVGIDIKMNVIRSAIVEDKEFTGLSARFVHRSLSNWWQFNGGRYLEKHMQALPKEEHEPAPPEVAEKYLKEWEEKVKAAGSRFTVPALTPEEIKREGQEKPNLMQEQLDKLAPKTDYRQQPDYVLKVKENIRRICAETYKHLDPHRMPKGFESFRIGEYDIYCESADKAKEIYEKAMEF